MPLEWTAETLRLSLFFPDEFGLTKEDGSPNEQGIDDVAKIANWDTRGGAPKTPGNE
jgi:hypothetical protein